MEYSVAHIGNNNHFPGERHFNCKMKLKYTLSVCLIAVVSLVGLAAFTYTSLTRYWKRYIAPGIDVKDLKKSIVPKRTSTTTIPHDIDIIPKS